MAAKYYIVHGSGEIWTIACPQCLARDRTLQKNLHSTDDGGWVFLQPRRCACGFESQHLASPLESTELRKLEPPQERASLAEKVAIGVGFLVVAVVIFISGNNFYERSEAKRIEALQHEAEARKADLESAIARHEVIVGMTPDEVRRAWGQPYHINRTTLAGHIQEQWVYRTGYVYLDNDAVTAVQQSD